MCQSLYANAHTHTHTCTASPAYGEGADGNALLLTRGSSVRRSTYTPSSLTASNSTVANPSTVSTITDAKDAVCLFRLPSYIITFSIKYACTKL